VYEYLICKNNNLIETKPTFSGFNIFFLAFIQKLETFIRYHNVQEDENVGVVRDLIDY
jgi:hypothetical protein